MENQYPPIDPRLPAAPYADPYTNPPVTIPPTPFPPVPVPSQPVPPAPVNPVASQQFAYAGFGRRFLASIIDVIIIGIIYFPIQLASGFVMAAISILFGPNLTNITFPATPNPTSLPLNLPNASSIPITSYSINTPVVASMILVSLFLYLIMILISVGYYVCFIAFKGQTPGKMIMKVKVVRENDFTVKVGFWKALLRETIGKIISSLLICLGYLWMLWDGKKQTWHDKIAGTIVIKV